MHRSTRRCGTPSGPAPHGIARHRTARHGVARTRILVDSRLRGVSVQPGGTTPAGAVQVQGAAALSTAAAASRPPAPAHPAGPTTSLPHAPTSALAHGAPAPPPAVGTPTMVGNPNPPAATAPPLNYSNSSAPATRTPTKSRFGNRSMACCCCGTCPSLSRPVIANRCNLSAFCAHPSQHAMCPCMLLPC